MMNLSDFLSEHELDLSEKSAPDSPGETLTVIMLGVSEDRVRFGHFGIVFEVDRSAVLGVRADPSPTPNPFGKGVACSLVLSRDAVLTRTLRVSVAELLGNLPFRNLSTVADSGGSGGFLDARGAMAQRSRAAAPWSQRCHHHLYTDR